MSNGLKSVLYIIFTFLIIWLIFGFVMTVLPWLLLAGIVIYIVVKIKGAILNKKTSKNNPYEANYTETNTGVYNAEVFQGSSDDNNTSVIDVDYKEVE